MNETDKPTITPQPQSIEEIFNIFFKIIQETGNWPAAYAAARKLTAENRAYYAQLSYENPPPTNKDHG